MKTATRVSKKVSPQVPAKSGKAPMMKKTAMKKMMK